MEVRIEPTDQYLYVRLSGELDLAEAKRVSTLFLEACVETGLSKVVVDVRRLAGHWTTMERYEYAIFMAEKNKAYCAMKDSIILRIAYVGWEPVLDSERFAETVAVNRGAAVKAFESMVEAREWLLAKSVSDSDGL